LEEREVTLALKSFLTNRNWKIISVHFPGAQGGLSISINGKSRGVVPDLIAIKDNVVLIVESKATYSPSDVDKLNEMFSEPRYFRKLERKVSLPTGLGFQRAIAFHSLHFDESNVPSGFVVFIVKGKSKVSIFVNTDVSNSVKDVFQL